MWYVWLAADGGEISGRAVRWMPSWPACDVQFVARVLGRKALKILLAVTQREMFCSSKKKMLFTKDLFVCYLSFSLPLGNGMVVTVNDSQIKMVFWTQIMLNTHQRVCHQLGSLRWIYTVPLRAPLCSVCCICIDWVNLLLTVCQSLTKNYHLFAILLRYNKIIPASKDQTVLVWLKAQQGTLPRRLELAKQNVLVFFQLLSFANDIVIVQLSIKHLFASKISQHCHLTLHTWSWNGVKKVVKKIFREVHSNY